MNTPHLVMAALALCSLGAAGSLGAAYAPPHVDATAVQEQRVEGSEPASSLSTSTCSYTFSSGTGDTFLKYCVTANGNITQLEAPAGSEHIRIGAVGEGYGLCDFSGTTYYDYAEFGDTPNWGPATLVSQSATTVVIARTTSDGLWTLTQTITQSASTSSAIASMALKNNSTVDRHVWLLRFVDADAQGVPLNSLGSTFNSAFAWNPLGGTRAWEGRGLLMQNAVGGFPNHAAIVFRTDGFPRAPDPCPNIYFGPSDTLTDMDGGMFIVFSFPVPQARTVTVRVSYKGL